MPNISQISDSELMNIAQGEDTSSASKMSDEELLNIANEGKQPNPITFDFLNALGQFGKGVYENPILHPALKAIAQGTGSNAEEVYSKLPEPQNLPEQLSSMAGSAVGMGASAIPLTAGAAAIPGVGGSAVLANLLGMGAYGGAEALAKNMQGQPTDVGRSALLNALGGAVMGGAMRAGASMVPKQLPFAETLGSAVGGAAGFGALSSPEDRKVSALFGGMMGAVLPSQRFDAIDALANGVGPLKGLGYEKTAKVMGSIFNKTVGESIVNPNPHKADLVKMGGIDAVRQVGEMEITAPDGTQKTAMDIAQATREQGIQAVDKILSPQFATVLSNLDQVNLGNEGIKFLESLKKTVDDIAEPPSTSKTKAIWDKYQSYVYKTELPKDTLENAGIRVPEVQAQDLSALDKETANKIERITKSLQTRSTRSLSIQDLPTNLQQQVREQLKGSNEVSPTALDRMKRELSMYGNKGEETPDKAMARKMAGQISNFLINNDKTGAYGQLMDHYHKMVKIGKEVDKYDAVKLAKQYKGVDPTSENLMDNSITEIDNYFKSKPVEGLLKGANVNYLTGDLINKYHIYQTLANPNLFGFSHIYPMRILGGAAAGFALHPLLGPFSYPVGGIAAWRLSTPKNWIPLLEATARGRGAVKPFSPNLQDSKMLKKLVAMKK